MNGLSGSWAGTRGPGERSHALEVQTDPGELDAGRSGASSFLREKKSGGGSTSSVVGLCWASSRRLRGFRAAEAKSEVEVAPKVERVVWVGAVNVAARSRGWR